MEEVDKGCPMIRMGVSGFLLVTAYPGSPGSTAVKHLCMCVCVCFTFLVLAYPGCPGKEAVKWV